MLQKYRQLLEKLQAAKMFLQVAAIAACAKLQVEGGQHRRRTDRRQAYPRRRPLGSTLTVSPVLQHQLRGEGK
jgi:hypothetical protein